MRLRAPTPSDAPAVLAVLVARDVRDRGAPDYTLEDLRDEWNATEFDLGADAAVAETEDGQVAGYAAVTRSGTRAEVAPDREGRGIGTLLLKWAERREHELGATRHRQWIVASNVRGQALLQAAGYGHARSYWRMTRQLTDLGHEAQPDDFRLRSLDAEHDAQTLYELDTASFSANPDYEPESFVAFRDEHLRAHDLDPELSLVAEVDGRVVGFLLGRRWRDEAVGFVDLLAVHPDLQGRGLGSGLLQRAFALFAAAGLAGAQLGVASDNPRALGLYERAGMTPLFRVDTYERPIAAQPRRTDAATPHS